MRRFKQFIKENHSKDIPPEIKRALEDTGFIQGEFNWVKKFEDGVKFYYDHKVSKQITYYDPDTIPVSELSNVEQNFVGAALIEDIVHRYETISHPDMYYVNNYFDIVDNVLILKHVYDDHAWVILRKKFKDKHILRPYITKNSIECYFVDDLDVLPHKILGRLSLYENIKSLRELPYIPDAKIYNFPNFTHNQIVDEKRRREALKKVQETDKESTDLFGDIFDM